MPTSKPDRGANIRFVGGDALAWACTKHKSIWLMSHLVRHKRQELRILVDWISLLSSLGFRDTSNTHRQRFFLLLQPTSDCQVSCGRVPRKCVAIEQQVGRRRLSPFCMANTARVGMFASVQATAWFGKVPSGS